MSLKEYQRKRKFQKTPEPSSESTDNAKSQNLRFIVQMHRATRLHFDFRIELEGALKSWAVPKGPSLNPADQRLAVQVEDHPLAYGTFEGVIPKGNYGAGTVLLWDSGVYWERASIEQSLELNEKKITEGLERGKLTLVLHGHKLKGEFALVKLERGKKQGQEGERAGRTWLLVKKRDLYGKYKQGEFSQRSVKSGRTLDEITKEGESKGQIWLPGKENEVYRSESFVPPPGGSLEGFSRDSQLGPRSSRKKVRSKVLENVEQEEPIEEKFPHRLRPMIPVFSKEVFDQKGWIFEESGSGLRVIAEKEGKSVRLYSKQGLSFNERFPEIVGALETKSINFIVDGEIIPKGKEIKSNQLFVFDLLHLDGKNYRVLPLSQRKRKLRELNVSDGTLVFFRDHTEEKGVDFLEKGRSGNIKEILAKDSTSAYRPGTTKSWLKIKVKPNREKESEPASLSNLDLDSNQSERVIAPGIRLKNLKKVFWPEEGYTKGDVANYYERVGDLLLPHLVDRPQSLNRHPDGIFGQSFFQKDVIGHLPKWLRRERIFSESAGKSIDYVVCDRMETLLFLVNLGCIELNPWLSKASTPDHPEFFVIDLDPNGRPFTEIVEIANEVHRVLDIVGVESFCKTSGATGLHICIPTQGMYDYELGRRFCESVSEVVLLKFGDIASLERSPSKRRGKIYLDCLQNRRGQTLAAPYSIRPRPGATVSTPLSWEEVRATLRPDQFTIETVPNRLKDLGNRDLWSPLLTVKNDLDSSGSKIKVLFR